MVRQMKRKRDRSVCPMTTQAREKLQEPSNRLGFYMPLGVPSFTWGDMFSSHGKYPNWIIVAKNILEHLQCQRVSSVTVRRFRNPYLPRPSKIGGTHVHTTLAGVDSMIDSTNQLEQNKAKWQNSMKRTRNIQWGKSKEPSWTYNKSVDCGANQSEAYASR